MTYKVCALFYNFARIYPFVHTKVTSLTISTRYVLVNHGCPGGANDSVAFQSFTISWNLNMGYKTKVITLTPHDQRSTITSNEENEMIKSTEIRNSNNTCSSRLRK